MGYNPNVLYGKTDYLVSVIVVRASDVESPISFKDYLKRKFLPFVEFRGFYFILNANDKNIYDYQYDIIVTLTVEKQVGSDDDYFAFYFNFDPKYVFQNGFRDAQSLDDSILYKIFRDKAFNCSLLKALFSSFEDYLRYIVGESKYEFRRVIQASIYSSDPEYFRNGLREWLYSKERLSENAIKAISSFV